MSTPQNPREGGAAPLFLEKRSYRMRRVMDVVRLLPVLGFILWMVPLLWPHPEGAHQGGVPLSTVIWYVFMVWFLLVCSALLAFVLRRRVPEDDPSGDMS